MILILFHFFLIFFLLSKLQQLIDLVYYVSNQTKLANMLYSDLLASVVVIDLQNVS